MKLVKRTNVVLHLIDKHLLKIKEDKIDIFTHLVMNAGRQGKVRLENTLTFGMVIDSVVFIFPVAPVGPASNIHHVGFGGDGRGGGTSDGIPVVDILVEAFHESFQIIAHCIPAIPHTITLEGADTIGVKIMKLAPMIKILFCVWIHDDAGMEI